MFAFWDMLWYAVDGWLLSCPVLLRNSGQPSLGGQLLALQIQKGGPAHGYLSRFDSSWHFDRRHYRPVYSGKKEVTAGP